MPVVVPYTRLHPRTRGALARFSPCTSYVRLDRNDDRSYWELLAELWARGEAFVIVEHDVEVHCAVVPSLDACEEPWCAFPFARLLPGPHSSWDGAGWGPGIALLTKSLGCTRFSAELLVAEPDVMEKLGEWSIGGSPPGHWKRLDDGIAIELEARGYQVHVHHPEVVHHHDLTPQGWAACTCGTDCAQEGP